MSEELILVFSIVVAQVVSASVLSIMLFWFARSLSMTNLRTWAWAMAALALSALGNLCSFYLIAVANMPAESVARLCATLGSQFGALSHLALLLVGALELLHGRRVNALKPVLLSAFAALLIVLPYSHDPDGANARLLLRVGLHYGLNVFAFGLLLLIMQRVQGSGRRAPRNAFAIAGVLQGLIAFLFMLAYTADKSYFGQSYLMIDLATTLILGAGLMIWLVDEQRLLERGARADLKSMQNFDPETGLANEQRLRLLLDQAIHLSSGNGLMVIDLNHFRALSDTLDHSDARAFVVAIAERLRQALPAAAQLARLKQDEFAVWIPGATVPSMQAAAQLLHHAFAAELRFGEQHIFLNCTIGIALEPQDASDAAALQRAAQLAAAQALHLGGGQSCVYAPALNVAADLSFSRSSALRRALNEDQFVLHYQPIFNRRLSLVGFEALIRWQHPTEGLLMPSEFVPHLGAANIATGLDRWVLRHAIAQIQLWRTNLRGDLTVAVNICAQSFQQLDFPQRVARALADAGAPGRAIELEITESMALENLEQAEVILKQLKTLEVPVTLDDFGTGFSSLSHLRNLPIQRIKIDRSFVRDVNIDSKDAAIVTAMIELAHSLGLMVTAEGVENAAQRDFLETHNVDLLQGFLLGKPVPASEIDAAFVERSRKLVLVHSRTG